MADELPPDDELLTALREADWPAIQRILHAGGWHNDVETLRNTWVLVDVYTPPPHRERLQRRIEALGRAAAKTAARLAKEQGDAPDPAPVSAPTVPAPTVPAGQGAPARRHASGTPAATTADRFEVDPAEELDDFLRSLRKTKKGASVTREEAAAALAEWHQAFTVQGDPLRFVSNAGRTGIVLHEWLVARYGAMVVPARLESERVWELTTSRQMVRILSWVTPDPAPVAGQHVTECDVHAQYLAAAHSVPVGDGEPTDHLDAATLAEWDLDVLTRCPGYVVLATAPDLAGTPAHVQGAFSRLAPGWALAMPLARYLVHDHDVQLDLAEAVIWHERRTDRGRTERAYGPRLSRWAKTVVAGRTALRESEQAGNTAAGLAHAVVKQLYTVFLGGLLRSDEHNDKDTLRPDWNDQAVALAGANMLRALDKAAAQGWQPIGAMKDSAWFVTDSPAPVDVPGLTFSGQAGKWHHTRWGLVTDDVVTAHASGNPTSLRKAITAADTRRRKEQDQ